MGESVVIVIIADDIVKFCGIIDCYEKRSINKVVNILDSNKITKIDFICLTHPDIDHCIGWTKLLNKVDSRTKIIYPINLLVFTDKYKAKVRKEVLKLAEFFRYRCDSSKKPNLQACSDTKSIISDTYFKNLKTGISYALNINTYSPITPIIERYNANKALGEELSNFHKNDFSIMMTIGVGDFKLLLGGDTENDSIRQITKNLNLESKKFFSDIIDYVKIPHHSSTYSNEIESLLCDVEEISNSVTTVFRTSKLPNPEIVNFYKKKSNKVYCTGNIDQTLNKEEYGVVEFDIDIINSTIKENFEANAFEL